eukprot:SAG11_NODE_349_length_10401_cov_22.873423_7_plen_467_part_00
MWQRAVVEEWKLLGQVARFVTCYGLTLQQWTVLIPLKAAHAAVLCELGLWADEPTRSAHTTCVRVVPRRGGFAEVCREGGCNSDGTHRDIVPVTRFAVPRELNVAWRVDAASSTFYRLLADARLTPAAAAERAADMGCGDAARLLAASTAGGWAELALAAGRGDCREWLDVTRAFQALPPLVAAAKRLALARVLDTALGDHLDEPETLAVLVARLPPATARQLACRAALQWGGPSRPCEGAHALGRPGAAFEEAKWNRWRAAARERHELQRDGKRVARAARKREKEARSGARTDSAVEAIIAASRREHRKHLAAQAAALEAEKAETTTQEELDRVTMAIEVTVSSVACDTQEQPMAKQASVASLCQREPPTACEEEPKRAEQLIVPSQACEEEPKMAEQLIVPSQAQPNPASFDSVCNADLQIAQQSTRAYNVQPKPSEPACEDDASIEAATMLANHFEMLLNESE